jgi:hypothetical protein
MCLLQDHKAHDMFLLRDHKVHDTHPLQDHKAHFKKKSLDQNDFSIYPQQYGKTVDFHRFSNMIRAEVMTWE